MKRKHLFALLCMTAILAAGCAETPEASSEVSEQPVQSETAEETAAVTEETPSEATTESSLSDSEQNSIGNEEQAEYDARYEEQHTLYPPGSTMVESAESWQDGYAKLLTGGDAIYLGPKPPTASTQTSYQLLYIDNSDIPDLVVYLTGESWENESYEPQREWLADRDEKHTLYEDYLGTVLFFRYEDGGVRYVDSLTTNDYFYYRPYCGDIGWDFGSPMTEDFYSVVRTLGDAANGAVVFFHQVIDRYDNYPSEEEASRYDISIDWTNRTGRYGETWASASISDFKEITPETIAELYETQSEETP